MSKKPDAIEMSLEYLRNKYEGMDFTYVSNSGNYPGTKTHTIRYYPNGSPDKEFAVICDTSTGSILFSDNYLSVRFYDETSTLLRKIITDLYGDNFYFVYNITDYATSENVKNPDSFSEFIADPTSVIDFMAIVNHETKGGRQDSVKEKLYDSLKANGLVCFGSIYYCTDKDDLSDLTAANYYSDYLVKNTYDACLKISYKNGEYSFKWGK